MQSQFSRTRWAALGAAVAISVGAGGVGITQATLGSGERTAYVPINPCRLADSRSGADHVGNIAGALAEDVGVTLDTRGANGDCDLPADAIGLALNVTALNQTRLTYLTLWPADSERPKTSNLNPAPGQPPTPNAVTVDLDAAGRFSVYNRFGSVDIVVDVVGYYADHHHDDRYYTKANTYTQAEIDALLATKADTADVDAALADRAGRERFAYSLAPGGFSEPIEFPPDGGNLLVLIGGFDPVLLTISRPGSMHYVGVTSDGFSGEFVYGLNGPGAQLALVDRVGPGDDPVWLEIGANTSVVVHNTSGTHTADGAITVFR